LTGPTSSASVEAVTPSPRILLIDDEPTVLRVLKLALDGAGWTVDTAPSAETALGQARTVEYDLFVVDKNLSGMSGIAFVRELRSRGSDAGVIVITGYASPGSAIEALNLGIDAYLEKPFGDVFDVKHTVAVALETHRRRRAAAASEAVATTEGDFRPLRIVVVASSARVRGVLAGHLDRRDHVDKVSGLDAVRSLMAEAPVDVLVLEGDGATADLIAALRADGRQMGCVVVGQHLPLATIRRLITLEVKRFVDCPVDAPELPLRLTDALDRYRVRKLIQELGR
jgi:DNA-binding NtrC family response regulator